MSSFSTTGDSELISDQTVGRILDAYEDHAFQQGYSRATRDLLAIYPLLIEQFLHSQAIDNPELRKLIRRFGRFVEEKVDRNLSAAGFTDGEGI